MIQQSLLAVVTLFASLVLLVTGNAMLGTIAALRLEIEGFDPGVIGIVLALTSLGFVLGSLYGVRVVRRVGHIRAFAAFAGVGAASALVHPLHVSVASWLALRLVLGLCVAGLMLVTESWINGRATAQTRGALLATYMVLFFLAASGGQFMVALGDPGDFQLFILAGILFALSLVPVSLSGAAPPEMEQSSGLGIRTLWQRSELGLAGAATSGLVLGAFGTVGPVYAYEMSLPVEEVARFMGISILAAMALQWPMGYLSDRVPRRPMIVVIAGAAAVAAVSTALFGHRSHMHLYVGVAVLYGLAACIYPMCLALTHDMLSKAQIVQASATMLLVNGVGAVAGPVAGGFAVSLFGPSGLMVLLAASLGALVALGLHSMVREKAPEVAEQSHCVGVAPVSTVAILDLDPRQSP